MEDPLVSNHVVPGGRGIRSQVLLVSRVAYSSSIA
jgi:hypothetical protein